VFELTSVYCPGCGDDAEDMAPENGQDFRELPWYRHVGDRTALWPAMIRNGYWPAEPVEGDRDEADL
jgi:hypothetical protein